MSLNSLTYGTHSDIYINLSRRWTDCHAAHSSLCSSPEWKENPKVTRIQRVQRIEWESRYGNPHLMFSYGCVVLFPTANTNAKLNPCLRHTQCGLGFNSLEAFKYVQAPPQMNLHSDSWGILVAVLSQDIESVVNKMMNICHLRCFLELLKKKSEKISYVQVCHHYYYHTVIG